jgi:hypothetical protein
LQTDQPRIACSADQDGSCATSGDEFGTPQDKCAHYDLADVSRTDYQGAQVYRIKGRHLAALRSRTTFRQRWTAGELADFACYFALFVNDDHGRATEPVSSGDFNTSGKNKECRRLGGSDVEQYFSRRVSAGWSARESKRSFALNCRQDRKELIAAPINDAHENSWVVASRSQPPLL